MAAWSAARSASSRLSPASSMARSSSVPSGRSVGSSTMRRPFSNSGANRRHHDESSTRPWVGLARVVWGSCFGLDGLSNAAGGSCAIARARGARRRRAFLPPASLVHVAVDAGLLDIWTTLPSSLGLTDIWTASSGASSSGLTDIWTTTSCSGAPTSLCRRVHRVHRVRLRLPDSRISGQRWLRLGSRISGLGWLHRFGRAPWGRTRGCSWVVKEHLDRLGTRRGFVEATSPAVHGGYRTTPEEVACFQSNSNRPRALLFSLGSDVPVFRVGVAIGGRCGGCGARPLPGGRRRGTVGRASFGLRARSETESVDRPGLLRPRA